MLPQNIYTKQKVHFWMILWYILHSGVPDERSPLFEDHFFAKIFPSYLQVNKPFARTNPLLSPLLLGHSVQFSSVPWPIGEGKGGGGTSDDSAEIFFQSFLQEAFVSSLGMGRDVLSLILSIQHFLCWPQHCPPSKVSWRMVLERLSWCVTCLNHASFHLLTVARRGSCGPIKKLILLCTQ